jgi:hypothetical protein
MEFLRPGRIAQRMEKQNFPGRWNGSGHESHGAWDHCWHVLSGHFAFVFSDGVSQDGLCAAGVNKSDN